MIRKLATATLVPVALFAGLAACARPDDGARFVSSDAPAVTVAAPMQAVVEPTNPNRPRTGPATAEIGRTYPFDLRSHCGIKFVEFGGQIWRAVKPRSEPQPRADANGTAVYTGYTAGTMTITGEQTAYFVIDLRYTVADDAAVELKATDEAPPECV